MLQTKHQASNPSFDRPIPYRRRSDLVTAWIFYRGVKHPVIKDSCSLKYFQLSPEQYAVLDLLDGERSLTEIRKEVRQRFPTEHFSLTDMQTVVIDLQEKGLLVALRLGQGPALLKAHRDEVRKKVLNTLRNPLYLQLPGWDPDAVLRAMLPFTRWLFHPAVLLVNLSVIAGSLLFLAIRIADIQKKMPEFQSFFAWPNLLYLWITMALIKVIHEFGHGLACRHYGSECHSIGIMLLCFSPTMYCDVTDSWMLKNKWQRIMIGAGGMYFEAMLSAVAILVWWNTQPGLLNYLCLNTFFVSTVSTVIFNANPLLRYDGYYMLSDLIEIPNLRQKADQITQQVMAKQCLGIDLPSPPFLPDHGRFWFITYVVASFLYRWVVFAGIITFFYTVLKPYRLQSVGILMAVVSILLALGGFLWNLYQLMSRPRRDPISKPRLAVTLGLAGVVAYLAFMVPFPWYIEAPFYIEPQNVVHIFNQAPGFIEAIDVQPGDKVTAGQPLLRLRNPDIDDRVAEGEVQIRAADAQVRAYDAAGRPDQGMIAREAAKSAREQTARIKEVQDQSTVKAPSDGVFFAPVRMPAPKLESRQERLSGWSGAPTQRQNLGAYLEPQTPIGSVAPTEKMQAVLVMDQAEREELAPDLAVRLQFEELPDRVLDGRVSEVAHRHLEYAPPGLSQKYKGSLVTVPDQQGRERLSSVTYQAIVPIGGEEGLIRPGMRGQARVHLFNRSLGGWIWRSLRTTFQFRL
jgi:putative peptide zinc metalloprotease protein